MPQGGTPKRQSKSLEELLFPPSPANAGPTVDQDDEFDYLEERFAEESFDNDAGNGAVNTSEQQLRPPVLEDLLFPSSPANKAPVENRLSDQHARKDGGGQTEGRVVTPPKSLEELLFPPSPPQPALRLGRRSMDSIEASEPEDDGLSNRRTANDSRRTIESPVIDSDSEESVDLGAALQRSTYIIDSASEASESDSPPSEEASSDSDSDSDLDAAITRNQQIPSIEAWKRNNPPEKKQQTILIDLTNSPASKASFPLPNSPTKGKKKIVLPATPPTLHAANAENAGTAHPALAQLTTDPSLLTLPEIPHPKYLTVTLMPHQEIGLRWLVGQERNPQRKGGILADDMGLGKTVQTIALMLANRAGSDSLSSIARDRKPTLIVATKALAPQWEREIKSKVRAGALSVLLYHGPSRPRDPRRLERYDVVITTYSTLEAERRSRDDSSDSESQRRKPELGTLFAARWLRVVLDEAHLIKNRKTKSAGAAYRLDAVYRLCLTGTPIINSLDDVQSLLRFLRVHPYSDYKIFQTEILDPYKRDKNGSAGPALERLKRVLATTMLRRTKTTLDGGGKPLLNLPPKEIALERCELGPWERQAYDQLESKLRGDFEGMQAAEQQRQFTTVLTYILKLRQCCNHPALIGLADDEEGADVDALAAKLGSIGVSRPSRSTIPAAKARQNANLERISKLERSWQPSAKVDKAMSLILQALAEDPGNKVCVFSQFTSMLDVIEIPLRKERVSFSRYDGTMSIQQREKVLADFRSGNSVRVMLISLKCGSLGLNLVCANRVLLIDPWWNGSIEDQAVDRVHRIG